jgi:hydrogenase 3 maturation protease
MKEVILAVGNSMNGDDGIGSYIIEQIKQYIYKAEGEIAQTSINLSQGEIMTIDGGTTPENYTSVIRKQQPDKLVLVDAAEMGLSPGSYRIISSERMGVMTMSTHNMPLSLFVSYVSQFCREVLLLGIQPKRMDINTTLSPELRRAGEQLALLIVKQRLNQVELFG